MNAKPTTELNRRIFVQKRNSVNELTELSFEYTYIYCCSYILESPYEPRCVTLTSQPGLLPCSVTCSRRRQGATLTRFS